MKKALIINPFGIGDAIFSMTLAEALKKTLPQVSVGFLGNERTAALLRMNKHLDAVHEFNRDEFRALRRRNPFSFLGCMLGFVDELKEQKYDTAFDLSLGREFSFLAFLAGIRRRFGFDYKSRGFFLTHKTPFKGYQSLHVVDWQLQLLKHAGLEPPKVFSRLPLVIPAEAEEKAARVLKEQGFGADDRYFVLAPGGGRSWGPNSVYKQWQPERFAAVANARGGRVLLLGDAQEEPLLSLVRQKLLVPSASAAGLEIAVVSALLRRAEFFLGNDGGLLHLSNALGVKTVSLYGPVDEKVYGPYGQDARNAVLTASVPCRPCYHQFHFPPCGFERRCLEDIPAEKVLAALEKIS